MKKLTVLFLLSLLVLVSCKQELKYKSGTEVITAMHEMYKDKWYKNFTFSQRVEHFKNDSLVNKEVWHEAYKAPSNLIIKFRSMSSGNGYLFKDDSLYVYAHKELAARREHINFLITLGFDVYNQETTKTIETLKKVKFDVEKMTTAEIDGSDCYVIGVSELSENKNHFYIDGEKFVFLKAVTFSENNKREVLFKNYQMIEGNYTATEIEFFTNNKMVMTEKYYNMKFPQTLPDSVFSIEKFKEARW